MINKTVKVVLHSGREKSVLRGHPWIFSGAVKELTAPILQGAPVMVTTEQGEELGWGAYSPFSQIRVRMWTRNTDETVDRNFLETRLNHALELRKGNKSLDDTNAKRVVFAESDGIPGLIIDQYNATLVVQFLSAGVEYFRPEIIDIISGFSGIKTVYERSDVEVRSLEGLSPKRGLLGGEAPGDTICIQEGKIVFNVDIVNGQKTGFYLDQRDNRYLLEQYAEGKDILNCFCYTGGFSLHALFGGAEHVLSVDSSEDALNSLNNHLFINNINPSCATNQEADVFIALRKYRDQNRKFDLIILDPPKFAATTRQVPRATRAYKDINLLAFKLLKPGGILFTFSCSGGMTRDLFCKVVAGAAMDAGVDTHVLHYLSQSGDHPISLKFPESEYLKGMVIQIV